MPAVGPPCGGRCRPWTAPPHDRHRADLHSRSLRTRCPHQPALRCPPAVPRCLCPALRLPGCSRRVGHGARRAGLERAARWCCAPEHRAGPPRAGPADVHGTPHGKQRSSSLGTWAAAGERGADDSPGSRSSSSDRPHSRGGRASVDGWRTSGDNRSREHGWGLRCSRWAAHERWDGETSVGELGGRVQVGGTSRSAPPLTLPTLAAQDHPTYV